MHARERQIPDAAHQPRRCVHGRREQRNTHRRRRRKARGKKKRRGNFMRSPMRVWVGSRSAPERRPIDASIPQTARKERKRVFRPAIPPNPILIPFSSGPCPPPPHLLHGLKPSPKPMCPPAAVVTKITQGLRRASSSGYREGWQMGSSSALMHRRGHRTSAR